MSINDQQNKQLTTLIDFAQFLRSNCDKLFEKDSKLCLKTDQLFILQDYLEQFVQSTSFNSSNNNINNKSNIKKNIFNTNEFLTLYKSNQLQIIQDFLYKITNVKIIGDLDQSPMTKLLKLNIFGSLTYLEIKNCSVLNINDLQNLRNQLEVLICIKSVKKVQDLLLFCGGDKSIAPGNWSKLHTLNLSHNNLEHLDSSFSLATSIVSLDLSHNQLKDCSNYLHDLKKLKKCNLSFNKFETIPSLTTSNENQIEYLDLSYNNIDRIESHIVDNLVKLVYLNLNSNFLNDIKQIKNLKFLNSILNISLEKNPIKNNPFCDFIIEEIKLHKKSNQVVRTSKVNQKPQFVIKNNNNNNNNSLMISSLKSESKQRKLKANNILIEHEDENEIKLNSDFDDYYFLDPAKSSLNNKLSISYTEYESTNLQVEIEKLKQMRQDYGTDWLLSSSSLIENNKLMVDCDLTNNNNNNTQISATMAHDKVNFKKKFIKMNA